MKVFLIHLAKFLFTAIVLFVALIYVCNRISQKYAYKNNETEANLFLVNESEKFDFMILGISHARNISRFTHHSMFDSIFQASIINLSQGDGLGGLENQNLYLSYFLKKKNKAKNLILVLSPTLMYSNKIDQNPDAYYREPIRWDFIKHILMVGGINKHAQLFHYIKSKLGHHWWQAKPIKAIENKKSIVAIDTAEMTAGFAIAYPQGIDNKVFEERCHELERMMSIAHVNGMNPIIVIPPAVFGKWPGHQKLVQYIASRYPTIKFIDCSMSILDPKYYSDHHHLNSLGMKRWIGLLVNSLRN